MLERENEGTWDGWLKTNKGRREGEKNVWVCWVRERGKKGMGNCQASDRSNFLG
jgi:hypothetical protein